MNWLKVLGFAKPIVMSVVELVESLMGAGNGAGKKELAESTIKEIWDITAASGKVKEIDGVPFEAIGWLISLLIDIMVSLFNATGYFDHDDS